MIQHIILLKAHANTPDTAVDKIMEAFLACTQQLEGSAYMMYGPNASSKQDLSKGFNYGIILAFVDEHVKSAFIALKEHKEAIQLLKSEPIEDFLVFDIH